MKRKAASGLPRRVSDVLEQLRASPARVKTGTSVTAREIAAFERKLGFDLPASYRAFLGAMGGLRVNEWRFYGVTGAGARIKAYAREFAAGADDEVQEGGPYFPKRFVVLADQGDYSNAGAGWVFDADLGAALATDGSRWIERGEPRVLDHWDWLAEQLEALHEEVAAEDAAETQRVQTTAALTATASQDAEPLYAAFAGYERAPRWHCSMKECKPCVASNRAFDKKPLRKLTEKDLGHYVDYALDAFPSRAVQPKAMPARQRAFKHFLPRCLELIGELGCNQILRERQLFARGFLTAKERRAVDAWLTSYWQVMLQSAATLPANVTIFLRCVPDLGPYLAAWEASTAEPAYQLRVRCAEDLRHGDSLLLNDCLNAEGNLNRRAKEIARWLSPGSAR